jgi:hypothetical protein
LFINIIFLKFRYSTSKIGSEVFLPVLFTVNVFGLDTNVSTGGVPSKVVAAVFFEPLKKLFSNPRV